MATRALKEPRTEDGQTELTTKVANCYGKIVISDQPFSLTAPAAARNRTFGRKLRYVQRMKQCDNHFARTSRATLLIGLAARSVWLDRLFFIWQLRRHCIARVRDRERGGGDRWRHQPRLRGAADGTFLSGGAVQLSSSDPDSEAMANLRSGLAD